MREKDWRCRARVTPCRSRQKQLVSARLVLQNQAHTWLLIAYAAGMRQPEMIGLHSLHLLAQTRSPRWPALRESVSLGGAPSVGVCFHACECHILFVVLTSLLQTR